MGSQNSKIEQPGKNQPFRRDSSKRASKRERASSISLGLKEMRQQIAQFDGLRDDERYKNFQTILTRSSQEVQDLKRRSKSEMKDFCDNVQADVIDLLRFLEEIVSKNENDLDSAAVESHSFINQTPIVRKKEIAKNSGRMTNLGQIEESTTKLAQDINNAIELHDYKQFVVFEKKIKLLYTDLEMIDVEEHTPLHERKESISRKLIRYNNKMRKAKTRTISQVDLLEPMNEEEKKRKTQKEIQIIMQIEMKLEDLEVRALTFEDVKSDAKYKELDGILKEHWATLQNLGDTSETNRRRKLKTIDLIKKILRELNNRAEENASKIKAALEKINLIDEEVRNLALDVGKFQNGKSENAYKNLDQQLRSLWAKLNDIHVASEKIVLKKEESISNIQNVLKELLEKADAFDKATMYVNKDMLRKHTPVSTAQIVQKIPKATPRDTMSEENYNLIAQTKELQNHWNSINKVITENLTSSDKNDVVNILDSLSTEINRKIQELQRLSSQSFRNDVVLRKKKDKTFIKKTSKDIPLESKFQPQDLLVDELISHTPTTKMEIKTLPTAEIFGQIQKIQNEVNEMAKSIQILGPKDSNYNQHHIKLTQHLSTLQNIRSNSNMVVENARTKAIELTQKTLESLNATKIEQNQTVKTDSKKQTEEMVRLKGIIENLQKLKKKVDCFYGTYRNIQYVQIEKELNSCLEKLDLLDAKGNAKIETSKNQIKQKIEQYLNILDEKSLKVTSPENDEKSPYKQIDQLRTRLTELKSAMENFTGKHKDEAYVKLESEVEKCREDLKAINEINNSIKSSKKQYYDYIDQLLAYFQEKILSDSKEAAGNSDLLSKFEEEIVSLKREIASIGSTITDSQFYYLDDNLLQVQLKIFDIKTDDQVEEIRKKNLIEDIQTLMNFIQSKREATKRMSRMSSNGVWEKIQEIRDEIFALAEKIEDFGGPNVDARYDQLDEAMSAIFLKIKLIEDNGNQQVTQACEDLIKEVQNNKHNLNKKLISSKESVASGTEV